ncbi:MAG: TolB family protein [Acidimicrobiia bacterium]
MTEDQLKAILSRVERPTPPEENFAEGLYTALASKLETTTANDPAGQILSRVELYTSPDDAFAEKLYTTLATQLEAQKSASRRIAFLPTIRSIAERGRLRLNGLRLQVALASALVIAIGILALLTIPSSAPRKNTPLAGAPTDQVGEPTTAPTFPSSVPNGCVCPIPSAALKRQVRGGTAAVPERGQLPPSAATFQLAFAKAPDSASGHFQIYTMNLDGTNLRRVTPDDGNDYRQPSWSPDRKRLAFTRTDSGPRSARFGEIFVANADGSDMSSIAQGGSPEWSPDGTLIVHHRGSSTPAEGPAIWTMKPDGTSPRMLTENGTDATFSPDGQYIAFGSLLRQSQFPDVPEGAINEFRMRSDGSEVVQLTGDPTLTCFADWSPDGNLIAYTSQLGVFTRLMLMTPNGTGHRQITYDDVSNVAPSWSPDSSLIAFEHAPRGDIFYIARPADPNGDPSSIWVMKPDGSLLRRISPLDGWSYFDPAFAP